MTAPALAPYRPLTAAEKAADRCGIALSRRALHRDFPAITAREAVDQALAATDRRWPR